jgi:hypothetical protein
LEYNLENLEQCAPYLWSPVQQQVQLSGSTRMAPETEIIADFPFYFPFNEASSGMISGKDSWWWGRFSVIILGVKRNGKYYDGSEKSVAACKLTNRRPVPAHYFSQSERY